MISFIRKIVKNAITKNKTLSRLFITADQRFLTARNNFAYSFLYKMLSTATSILLIPITIRYLNPTKYGIWLTLSSVISWIAIFDIGLGNGLRNKFGEALAKNDKMAARTYVSTTYIIISIIVIVAFLLFLIIHNFIDWTTLLNVTPDLAGEINFLAFLVFTFFLLRIIFGLIISILTADQKLGAIGLIDFITNLLSLLIVIVLPYFQSNSLLWLGGATSFITMAIPAAATIYYFNNRYRSFSPSFTFVNFKFVKDLMNLSLAFFVLSISTIIVYFSQNLIITQLFGPEEVTPFNIAYKYFFYVVIIHILILNPMLPAATEAYFKGELGWIKRILKKLILIWGITALGLLLMILVSDYVYQIWIGDQVKVPFKISLFMGLYITLFTWYSTFSFIINGIGKIRLQLYIVFFSGLLIAPLSIFLVENLHFGVEGVIFAGLICTIPGSVVIPIQLYKILSSKAEGIWNK